MMSLVDDCVRKESEKAEMEIRLEQALKQIVYTTTAELLGDNEDPEEILERFI